MKAKHTTRRAIGAIAAIGLVGLGACSDVLDVENPGAINDAELDNSRNAAAFAATAASDFQRMYDDVTRAGALLTDEAFNGHNFTQWIEIDMRVVDAGNSILNSDIYTPLQRARASGDDLSARLRPLLGAGAGTNLDLAQILAYAGYSNLLLGEYFCSAPVAVGADANDPKGAALSSQQLYARSIERFDSAIAIAGRIGTTASSADQARAAQLRNMARVGAARAALQMGDNAKAIAYATPVPASFEAIAYYDSEKTYQENELYWATTGTSSRYLGVEARFRGLNDVRIRHSAPGSAHNPDVQLSIPRVAPAYIGYDSAAAALYTRETDIRFASGLEARYIRAEAEGPTAFTLALVNERRAFGRAAALAATATGDQIMAELREQRSRDFYLAGTRLGDLRRYLARGVNDPRHVFPSGVYPTAARGNYGTATCFVMPTAETIGNPSV